MATPTELPTAPAASTELASLVHHTGAVEHDLSLEQVQRAFGEQRVDFLAITRDGMVTGICSRLRLGMLLGTRYGFALYGRSAAQLAQVDHPLVFPITTPANEVLDAALGRPGDEFNEDVALVDAHGALIGLVPAEALARLQSRLFAAQLAELERGQQELLAANEALRQSRGRYAGLFDSHALGVALLDATGTVHAHNQRLAALLNLDDDGAEIAALAPWLVESDRPAFLAELSAQDRSEAAPVAREFSFAVPGRGTRLFRCSLGWIPETRQVCACFDDITEHRAMERRLLRQEKQLLLDTLVGGIAHELNNKLTPVQGFSELIATSADAPTRQYAGLITKSVSEAARIIRQLLQLSKPSGTVSRAVDLRTVMAEALTMLKFQIREYGCAVTVSEDPEPVCVRADAAEIKQVLINLGLNALQAMSGRRDGELSIAIRHDAGRARIEVADNGVGIPPENLERIFDPFFTTKGPEQGTGLGLSVCYSIVRLHGGDIEVRSEPGAGARFTVTLPAEAAPLDPPLHDAPPASAAASLTLVGEAAPAAGTRVLVVEDEPHVRRLIQTVLSSRFDCEVDTVANGVEAFERLAAQRYAMVISDIRMATMNGTELYLWLQEAQPSLARRFLFITGYPGETHFAQGVAEWRVPVLAKPFTVAQLCEACAPFLGAGAAVQDCEPACA